MGAKEPSVPLVVFNQMHNGLLRLIEQEGKARREHEERVAKIIADGLERIGNTIAEHLKPVELPAGSDIPLRISEEEEDLAYARATNQVDGQRFSQMKQELEFLTSSGVLDNIEFG